MSSDLPILRLSPEPWAGVACEYNEKFQEQLKEQISVRAWDRRSFTWWFPRSYEPFVSNLLRENNLIGKGPAADQRFVRARGSLYAEKGHAASESDYAIIGLHPSAPPEIVEMVMAYWKQRFDAFGAPSQVMIQMQGAYDRIFSTRVENG